MNKRIHYIAYLKSYSWRMKRTERMIKDNYICQDCGCRATQVHHLTYDRVFNEDINDLISLCEDCHISRHDERFSCMYDTYEDMINDEIARLMENPNA